MEAATSREASNTSWFTSGRSPGSAWSASTGAGSPSTLATAALVCRPTRPTGESRWNERHSPRRAMKSYNLTGFPNMIQFHSLEILQLERFLERHKSGLPFKGDIDLDLVLR